MLVVKYHLAGYLNARLCYYGHFGQDSPNVDGFEYLSGLPLFGQLDAVDSRNSLFLVDEHIDLFDSYEQCLCAVRVYARKDA